MMAKKKEPCSRGHILTPENVYTYPNGTRACVACRRAACRAWYAANKTKDCARGRAWRDKNKERARDTTRGGWLRRSYGITPEFYNVLSKDQGGVCLICGGTNKNGKRLSVDHDHVDNSVRGLLCNNCNTGLGYFKDSSVILRGAFAYLEKHSQLKIILRVA